MSPLIKKGIIALVVIVVLAVGYNVFFKSKAPVGNLSSSTPQASSGATAPDTEVGRELLSTLLNLRTIKLNDQIFKNPAFTSLQDFTITLVGTGTEGRPNPFAPIGSDQTAPVASGNPAEPGVPAVPPSLSPAIITAPATNITKNTATLNGAISSNEGSFSAWFEWNKVGVATPAVKTTPVNFAGSVTSFSVPLTGLLPSTNYTFVASVKIGDITLLGASVAFTTPAN